MMDPATFEVCQDITVLSEVSSQVYFGGWRFEKPLGRSFLLSITEQQAGETFDVTSLVELFFSLQQRAGTSMASPSRCSRS